MKGLNKLRIRALFQICFVIILGIIVNLFIVPGIIKFSGILLVISFSFVFIITFLKASSVKKYERSCYLSTPNKSLEKICVVTACKNEGDTIVNTVKHYLEMSDKIHFALYDDTSTDGSYEELQKLTKVYPKRFILKKLQKRNLQIHPKAFALEDAFNSVECDYFLVIDSDSIILEDDFSKSVNAIINDNIDLLHLTRSNDMKSNITNKMGDIEELMFLGLRMINFQTSVFGGSGFFVRSKSVKGFRYNDSSMSEDTYLNSQLKKKSNKIRFFLTLYCHEKAPETFKNFYKQRFNWINMCIPYFLLHEFLQLAFWNFIFSIVFISLFNPFSIGFPLVTLCLATILALETAIAIIITKKNILKTMLHTLAYLLFTGYLVLGTFLWIQVLIMLGKDKVTFEKNKIESDKKYAKMGK